MNRTNVQLTPEQLFSVEKEVRYLKSIEGDELDVRIRSLVEHCMMADVVIEGLQDHAIHTDFVIMELLNQLEEEGVGIAEAKVDADVVRFLKVAYAFDTDY